MFGRKNITAVNKTIGGIMFTSIDFEKVMFKWPDLYKQVGMITVFEPTESDIAEGNFLRQVWFVNGDKKNAPTFRGRHKIK